MNGESGIFDCAPPDCTYLAYPLAAGDILVFDASTSGNSLSWAFTKTTDSGVTILNGGSSGTSTTYYYTVTPADISSTVLQFYADANASD